MRATNNRMTGRLIASTLALGLVAIAQPAMAGISTTRHNLGSTNTSQNRTTGTTEICVFCHTPHGAMVGATVPPLWNKYIDPATTYQSYATTNSGTFDAVQSGPGGVSLACLTCHDGTQAMDNILNLAGSGGFTSNGGGANGNTNYVWFSGTGVGGATVTGPGVLTNSTVVGGRNPVLGTDLRNDHPIGMNYCASKTDTVIAAPATDCNDVDFKAGSTSGTGRKFIDTDGDTVFEKTDFPLFTTGTITVKVECATCHDPHTNNALFLRMVGSNTSSQVCLACHTK